MKNNRNMNCNLPHGVARNVCGFQLLRFFSAIRKNKFPQMKITANVFSANIYPRVNTVLRNRVCSITICYFHSQTMIYWFYIGFAYCSIVWKYAFLLHVLNKNENISKLGTRYFLKIAKINFQQEKTNLSQSQKFVSAKHRKLPIRKNFVPHGVSLHGYFSQF